jgi:hypothetical protein
MSVPNQIRIAELDFDQILTNLIEFMKTDPAFADYDFAGSGLRLLTRVLAYVTFYQNYYLTSAVNESFLDTAQLRSSIASHAKMLGYDIHGTLGARLEANVVVELDSTDAAVITLPALTQFVLAANSNLSFYNLADVTLTQNADTLLYENVAVEIVEGTPLDYRFTVDLTNPTQRFVIPNANVDYSTISVQVQSAFNSSVFTAFQRATSYLTIGPTDPVFFVQEAYDGYPEVTFGNDVVGQALEQGNIVIVSFLIAHGTEGNDVRGPFGIPAANVVGFVTGYTLADANTVPSMGGAEPESPEDVRFMAPSVYQAQNRCVTVEDYKAIILNAYGDSISAINVFGGEQGDPSDPANRPLYGRVFIAIKPKIGLRFTDITRKNIEDLTLKPRVVVGTIPQVIDPDYVYLNVATSVKYDPKLTTRTQSQLQTAVANSILTYAQNSLEKFDTAFYYSKFTGIIDNTDEAIVSSLTRVDLEKRIYPVLGISNQFTLKFNSPLRVPTRSATSVPVQQGSVVVANQSVILPTTTHRFTYEVPDAPGTTQDNCFFYEWGGVVHVAYRATNGAVTILKTNIGTLDSDTGLVILTDFVPESIEGGEIDVRIRVIPTLNDFTPRLNQLFTMDTTGVAVQTLNAATATLDEQTAFFSGGILP